MSDISGGDFAPRPWLPTAQYYIADGHDVRDLIEAFGLNYNRGAVVKYMARAGRKPGNDALLDLLKAREHINREIASLSDEKAPATRQLTLAEIIAASLSRAGRWHPGGIEEWSVSDWAVALAGEAGELCNAVKKLRRIETDAANLNEAGRQLDTREAAIAAIAAELADTLLYMPMLAALLRIDLEAAIIAKFNAVSERYGFPERLGG